MTDKTARFPRFAPLFADTAAPRVASQARSVRLLFEKALPGHAERRRRADLPPGLAAVLSDASTAFRPDAVQQEIYTNDSGTSALPDLVRRALVNLHAGLVVRPGTLEDLQAVVRWAHETGTPYCVRGAGTWPFGGAVAVGGEMVVDLSHLRGIHVDAHAGNVTVGCGAIIADIRRALRDHGLALRQEITNPSSGTLCGWIATGGLGLGSYKYGSVQQSVEALLHLRPDGELAELRPGDPGFADLFMSEGQLGIVAGAVVGVKRDAFVSKPYAFSFPSAGAAVAFMELVREWELTPTSVLYFDAEHMRITTEIGIAKHARKLEEAVEADDELRTRRERRDLETARTLAKQDHVVVLEFDTRDDYEDSLRRPLFGRGQTERRFRDLTYRRLSVRQAHMLWEHRYLPVQMKSRGPSMLVSEVVLPLEKFTEYADFLRASVSAWTSNPLKTEAHLLPGGRLLVQTILLADTAAHRHKLYLSLVPFMTQAAVKLGGWAYGTGLWNLPFLRDAVGDAGAARDRHAAAKDALDPRRLLNRARYVNARGRNWRLKLFARLPVAYLRTVVNVLMRGRRERTFLGRVLWRGTRAAMPAVVPPNLAKSRSDIAQIISVCAECDSCERVCPTSDVFGSLGPATPITRRKTAGRVARGEAIDQAEALAFLACTRCDNCTRVCPVDIPLTRMFDLVEADTRFQTALALEPARKQAFVDRMWDVMKESPLYLPHTKAEQKEERSHLQHGLRIRYPRGFAYGQLVIDPETCIRCGMCADENACTYGAREGVPRAIPTLVDENCALCNACINFCPQNKAVQVERDVLGQLAEHAVDRDERTFWLEERALLRDTTTVERSPQLTEMSDAYVTQDILMEIDKEASTGQIPVSGMGQGDRHMGIGFDAERFSHFHIVGPAQNRLHEGDPDEELSTRLGKRWRYCRFDADGNLTNAPYPGVHLRTPILFNAVGLQSMGRAELAFLKVAEKQHSLVAMELTRFLEHYETFKQEGGYERLPRVVVPRVDGELISHLQVHPRVSRDLLSALWDMPMYEIVPHDDMGVTADFIRQNTAALRRGAPLLSGYLEVGEHDITGGVMTRELLDRLEAFLALGVDCLHVRGLRNQDHYFVTSQAVRAVHHHLMQTGRRHKVSVLASGGIRLASDTQKTVQRGAEATFIDFAALLALDPYAYRAELEGQATTDRLIDLDVEWAVKRLTNQMESRKVQILEVLGAAGFKDIKKTIGEEGRLIDFYELEERIQKDIFERPERLEAFGAANRDLLAREPLAADASPAYTELAARVRPLPSPHNFYDLGPVNQTVYQRDHVWPGDLIRTVGRMAAGDMAMTRLGEVRATGLLGDGLDVMKILYRRDPDNIPDAELDGVSTALRLHSNLVLRAPWMFGGKSVGSVGLDTWRAHVIASRTLGIQFDTGEGGYPTSFFLNSKGEPLFFTEPEVQAIRGWFAHDTHYTAGEIRAVCEEHGLDRGTWPGIYAKLEERPERQPFLFYEVIGPDDEPYVSTELKTGLFGVTKETIRKARRVVIAYSQGAKMGIGGHILAGKVNRLVSYLRGIQGLEKLNLEKLETLLERVEALEQAAGHPLRDTAAGVKADLSRANDAQDIGAELKQALWNIQQAAYEKRHARKLDPIEFESILRLSEEVISYSYTSVISPFPFHNCYSIEDVKSFIDIVRMINPAAVVSVKVSPSVDIEFIAAGLARIARDNTTEALRTRFPGRPVDLDDLPDDMAAYAEKHGMKIEVWLDGPRGGTGASPNIIKGQMGMHVEYAVPLIHDRLVRDGLRNQVTFMVAGGVRTYEDVVKLVALGADGVIWGTAPLVSIGCDRNRNCHDGCSRGIATSNLIMQNLRNVEINSRQMINAFLIMQMQLIRALAGLGFRDVRELRGRHDSVQWIGLKERVDYRLRQKEEHGRLRREADEALRHVPGQTNCGVAAVIGTHPVPSHVLDEALNAMRNRGMDGVGVGKSLCFPARPDHYAFRVLVKGWLQREVEAERGDADRAAARAETVARRVRLAGWLRTHVLEPHFEIEGGADDASRRESYKRDATGAERDYREFGGPATDPGDVFTYFVRAAAAPLARFVTEHLLAAPHFAYIREYFPHVTAADWRSHADFAAKAEDLYVFQISRRLTEAFYLLQDADEGAPTEDLVRLLAAAVADPAAAPAGRVPRARRLAAVMSCGRNFGVWKTAGREIPWETPAAPNNIIHVRLATGSVVEQMNSHPFAKLHTALTHNGETTNYEALKQRVEQFGLAPQATTDTEVASLKFHLLAEEIEYPDWALFEAFSPTTGDDLALIPAEMRPQLEDVQRVEFTSSPDGPYQYLCLRHLPEKRCTERIDLKDPADLRPNTTGIWRDTNGPEPRAFSAIASEEQAVRKVFELLDEAGLIEGGEPDQVLVTAGMINRFHYDEQGRCTGYEFIDRYGVPVPVAEPGRHRPGSDLPAPDAARAAELERTIVQAADPLAALRAALPALDFGEFQAVLRGLAAADRPGAERLALLTHLVDHLRSWAPGDKAIGSLVGLARAAVDDLLSALPKQEPALWRAAGRTDDGGAPASPAQTLVLDARGFEPEGTDPDVCLASFLNRAHEAGWRRFVLHHVLGQRLISTAVMGRGDTDDVVIDIHGTPGEYLGAFMQGGLIRCHGNAQNFTAMGMHHGTLEVYGNAGKVCGYASKGGRVMILGDVVDRAWTNSVNDPRCQDLSINIFGSASKYCGESLMGGDFVFGGLRWDERGALRSEDRPYRGTKLLGGASRGRLLFLDPERRLHPAQHTAAKEQAMDPAEWPEWRGKLEALLEFGGVRIDRSGADPVIEVDGKPVPLNPETCRLLVPTGGLKGYESH
ncbi:MAG TPA: glutamate synthase-related protein [Candidatus Krumholzibacteria bacterium]|nr:glutamate synthase-related protein [Candidatus Krumholzibacteria bacterium]